MIPVRMSTPHVQLNDEPIKSSCWETFRYACSSDYKKYLKAIGWVLLTITFLAGGFGVGIPFIWSISGHSPSNMDTKDYVGALLIGSLLLLWIMMILGSIGFGIYSCYDCCMGYYIKKQEELDKMKAENTPGSPV